MWNNQKKEKKAISRLQLLLFAVTAGKAEWSSVRFGHVPEMDSRPTEIPAGPEHPSCLSLQMSVSLLQQYFYLLRKRAISICAPGVGRSGAPWEVRTRSEAGECSSPLSFTVSAARRATTWRLNPGRAGMRGMRGAAPEPRLRFPRRARSRLPTLPSGAAPQYPAPCPRTPRAGDPSSSTLAGRGDRARPIGPLAPRTPRTTQRVQTRVPPPALTARGRGTQGKACRALSTQPLSTHLEPYPDPHGKSREPCNS